jgi:predicted nucleic acid binding AN1-type Zn finger protein
MEKIIAYCGIVCSECPAYIATQNNDDAKRRETAEQWTKQFGHEMKPEDINCYGCLTDTGRIVNYCAICEIRTCARERGMVNCAYCDDYACDKLEKFFQMAPMFRATLDEIRKGL